MFAGPRCSEAQRSTLITLLLALGALVVVLGVPAIHELVAESSARRAAGVARWAYGLLTLALLQGAAALYLWQLPDWSSMLAVAFLELAQAMLLAFVLGVMIAARPEHSVVEWLGLQLVVRSELARIWALFALAVTGATTFWAGRHALRWRVDVT